MNCCSMCGRYTTVQACGYLEGGAVCDDCHESVHRAVQVGRHLQSQSMFEVEITAYRNREDREDIMFGFSQSDRPVVPRGAGLN